MIVTGNVLPFEFETSAQKLFEIYGGLQRGFERREANGTGLNRLSAGLSQHGSWVQLQMLHFVLSFSVMLKSVSSMKRLGSYCYMWRRGYLSPCQAI